jgi:phosphate transport system substrate-binding protein
MLFRKSCRSFAAAGLILLGFQAHQSVQAQAPTQPPLIQIGGSSTVFPILEEAIRAYRARGGRARVTLSESGTTDGFRQFCQRNLAITNASRPINSQELRRCAANGVSFIELPIAFDAITVVVNRGNDRARSISTVELRRLWERAAEGRVDRWRQVNGSWPDQPIRLCAPGPDSGTFEYFNKAINGRANNGRRDVSSSEDDRLLVDCVARNRQAMGYFGIAYYQANTSSLRALAIDAGAGPITPSVVTVQNGSYRPLSRPVFLYVNDKALRERDDLRQFLTSTVSQGITLVEKVGMIPLPASTYRLVESKLYRHILGTSFGGDLPVGLSIGEALRRSFEQTRRAGYR